MLLANVRRLVELLAARVMVDVVETLLRPLLVRLEIEARPLDRGDEAAKDVALPEDVAGF